MLPPKEDGNSGNLYQETEEGDILAAKSLHSFDLNLELAEGVSSSKNSQEESTDLGFAFVQKKAVGSNSNPFLISESSGGTSSPPRASFEGEEEEDDDEDEDEEDEEEDENTCNSLIIIESSETQLASKKETNPFEAPMGGSTTTVDEITSASTNNGEGGGECGSSNAVEVVEVMKSLESYKTPDPGEMESSIVRANFVDFSIDDEHDSNETPLIAANNITTNPEDEDESKEFSLSLNPDLPKIRAQQIQNWLEFEKENEKGEDSLEGEKSTGDSGVGGGSGGDGNPGYDLDSLSEATGSTTTVTDADGVERRVRFLTDPHGNILISVYLTKLVQLILTILKLVSAGYLDFTSNSTTTTTTVPGTKSILEQSSSAPSSSSVLENSSSPSSPLLDLDESEIDPLLSSSFNFLSHYNETDDYVIPNDDHDLVITHNSEDGEEQIEAVHQANGNGTYGSALLEAQLANFGMTDVKLDALASAEGVKGGSDKDVTKYEELPKIDETEAKEITDEKSEGESTEDIGEGATKKVISVDPSLSMVNNFDEGEDIGSDSETMSTSSCSSMIEVVPKQQSDKEDDERELEFVRNDDDNGIDENNNNELKMDVLKLDEDPEVRDKSITSFEYLPENEIKSVIEVKGEVTVSEKSSDAATVSEVTFKKGDSVERSSSSEVETKNGVTSVLLNASPTQDENSLKIADGVEQEELKFNPKIEHKETLKVDAPLVDTKHPAPSPPAKPNRNKEAQTPDINGNYEHLTHDYEPSAPPDTPEGFEIPQNYGHDPETQLESLCIQEEPISAVALTIAKWESLSKKQKPKEPVERTNSAPKGKLILPPSYTSNGGNSGNTISIASIAQHQIHGKPVQVLPTGCNLNGILQSKVLGMNNAAGNGNPVPSSASPTNGQTANARSHSPGGNANNKLSVPGWSTFNNANNNNNTANKVPTEKTSTPEDEEAIYAQPNSLGGSLTTSLSNPSSILKSFPKPNSRGEIINWFKEGEIHRSGILLSYGQANHQSPMAVPPNVASPVIVSWFFGLITRQQAEEFLHGQPNGTFLVRISTRIWGYTLSYQSNNKTKHFLISAINPAVSATLSAGTEAACKGHNNSTQKTPPAPTGKQQMLFPFSPGGRYAFIGTNMTPYTTLASLIRHHSHAPITKAGGEKLVNPCPGGPKIAGIEYVFK